MIETVDFLGKSIHLYFVFWFLAMIFALITGFLIRKEYGFSRSQCVIYVVLDLVLGYLLIWVTSWFFGGGKISGFHFARIVSFVPLYFVLLAHLFKERLWKLSDFLAPVGANFFGTSHFGCIFAGCCQGYPSQWGLYSNVSETVCFPIQPIEAVTNLLIGIALCGMAKYKIQQGRLYAWFMILFGSTRFVFEFFRDNQKIWHNISELALHALAAMILGLVLLAVFKRTYKGKQVYEKI